ncbi:MAG: epoxyqueuosine reductase [Bacteroidetes bacterium]|nr:epoxyqueuosine reductase [Bacteroidota bacterium]
MSEIATDIIQKHLKPNDKFIYGYAILKGLPDPVFGNYQYGISIEKKLDDSILDQVKNGPTHEYHKHYLTMNKKLDELAIAITSDLNNSGIESINITPSTTTEKLNTVYNEDLRTELSHKMVATRAGLGWIGKTALFVSKEFGTRLRLVSILTKTELVPAQNPIEKSRCGTCSICVEACPANAATGQLWNVTIDRDEFFNAQACREQCRIFGESKLNSDIRICGICVAVCPIKQ